MIGAQEYWLNAAEPRLTALCNSRDNESAVELQARRQALAAESAAIRSFLWKFDTTFNELQPVSRLPSDVLIYIFSIVEASCAAGVSEMQEEQFADYTRWTTTPAKHQHSDWLSVTRVCSRWRNDALARSSLWSRIPMDMGTKGIDEFLSRSRDAPLVIDCAHGIRASNLIEVMQPAYMARTREIRISASLLDSLNIPLLSMLQNPAPQLEIFSLRPYHDINHSIRAITLPGDLLNNDAPRLRTFDVRQLDRWPIYPALFAQLREFSVTNSLLGGYTFPLPSEMRHVLRSMPLLEVLRLRHSMARGHVNDSDDDLVALPHLQELELSGPITACTAVLRPLRVAAGCKISVACADEGTSMHDHAAVLIDSLHDTGFSAGLAPKSLAIAISHRDLHVTAFHESADDPRSLYLRNSATPHRAGPVLPPNTVFNFRLDLSLQHQPHLLSVMAEHAQRLLAHALPIHAITSASVSTSTTADTNVRSVFEPLWTATLAPCSRLAKIHVVGPGAHLLLCKLAEPSLTGALFPALSLLVYDEPRISRTSMFENLSLYHILFAALQRRAIASVQIPESPQLDDADMDALRALTDLQTYPRAHTAHWEGVAPGWAAGDNFNLFNNPAMLEVLANVPGPANFFQELGLGGGGADAGAPAEAGPGAAAMPDLEEVDDVFANDFDV